MSVAWLTGLLLGLAAYVLGEADPLRMWPLLLALLLVRRAPMFPLGALVGLFVAHVSLALQAPPRLDPAELKGDLELRGWVCSLVGRRGPVRQLLFLTRSVGGKSARHRLRLSWPTNLDSPSQARAWRLQVRLREVRNFANPGGSDYRARLYGQGVRYSGYVRTVEADLGSMPWACRLHDWRQSLSARIRASVDDRFGGALLAALIVGDRGGLSQADWELLRSTGAAHLVAISGLHIGLVSMLVYGVSLWLLKYGPWIPKRTPLVLLASAPAMLAALVYAAAAGFALSTQRALIMLLVATWWLWRRRELAAWQPWLLAAVLVLAVQPLAIRAPGFWLSFGAVAAIGLVASRGLRGWRLVLAMQLGISVLTLPLLLFFFGQAPWLSPLVNLILVPLFSLLVVPLSLLGAMLLPLSGAGEWLLSVLGDGLGWLLPVLRGVASLDWIVTRGATPGVLALALALLAALWLLLPRGSIPRWPALLLCLPQIMGSSQTLQRGEFRVAMLDVGQGTSVVVETRAHTLVYDTGPSFRTGSDTARLVVLPYLRHRGRAWIDLLMLSHGDRDHAGGAASLMTGTDVLRVLSGEPARLGLPDTAHCIGGQRWQWDGVVFEVLHPAADSTHRGNNASCVLRVHGADTTLLLTGDIERSVEQRLLRTSSQALRADWVSAPHHASRSSSSSGFIVATGARELLVPAGYRNRFGFPKPDVIARWRMRGVRVWVTGAHGAIVGEARHGGRSIHAWRDRAQVWPP